MENLGKYFDFIRAHIKVDGPICSIKNVGEIEQICVAAIGEINNLIQE